MHGWVGCRSVHPRSTWEWVDRVPILEVEIVEAAEAASSTHAQDLADAAGRVLGCEPGRVWVKLRRLPLADYAENDAALPAGDPPVFVRVVMHQLPPIEERAALAKKLVGAIAPVCDRAGERVHLIFEPDAQSRIAFGGELR